VANKVQLASQPEGIHNVLAVPWFAQERFASLDPAGSAKAAVYITKG
jgi:hypothetical protein